MKTGPKNASFLKVRNCNSYAWALGVEKNLKKSAKINLGSLNVGPSHEVVIYLETPLERVQTEKPSISTTLKIVYLTHFW